MSASVNYQILEKLSRVENYDNIPRLLLKHVEKIADGIGKSVEGARIHLQVLDFMKESKTR